MTTSQSRRERPAKAALSREWIVAETMKIMETEGLEKATMRRVAQALDTGPASLYVYVANTAELHSAVLDELLGTVPPTPSGEWNERLEALLRAYGAILFAHPGLARSALLIRPAGPNALRVYDRILGLLLDGGVAADSAAWGVDLLLQYVTASAAEHSAPAPGREDAPADAAAELGVLAHALRTADPQSTPHIVEHAEAIVSGTPEQRVSWAVQALIAGIAATPAPTAVPTPTATPAPSRSATTLVDTTD